MRGILFAILGGGFITLQSVANARISQDIGMWQTASLTQLTGFLTAFLILLVARDGKWHEMKKVKPLYLTGGAFAAVILSSNVKAIQLVGVTLTTSAMLFAQLYTAFLVDGRGWFEIAKQNMRLPQFLGIGIMIAGVIILQY
ncbi:DMT family transporter [Neobacillus notoginsengisoli]|uniref:DMT family transporter n=1 Tax=Neobacillus notoginsengisoli TaxID=1578198 RepID=A0A417YWR8_9BACI|nr:DMT family transporter [Neobacillus notoginsengisoli]RHW42011.1 DMT family transporter [Neobacillus notoginsengisoli]